MKMKYDIHKKKFEDTKMIISSRNSMNKQYRESPARNDTFYNTMHCIFGTKYYIASYHQAEMQSFLFPTFANW